jgi:hypothetical protein
MNKNENENSNVKARKEDINGNDVCRPATSTKKFAQT